MHRPHKDLPISIYLSKAIEQISPSQLAASLEVKNIPKLLRRIDAWLTTGTGEATVLHNLISKEFIQCEKVLDRLVATTEILSHQASTLAQREHEQCACNFRPYIFVFTEKELKASFFSGLQAKALREIPLSISIEELSLRALRMTVSKKVQNHCNVNGGIAPFFGKITGYVLVEAPYRYTKFTSEGVIIETCNAKFVGHLPLRKSNGE
jgi:hypothetical protein